MPRRLPRDFRPDSFGSENLQQDGVRNASVNEVDLVDTRLQSSDGGTDLRDHATGDDTGVEEAFCRPGSDRGDEAGGVPGVGEEAGNIRNVDQLGGLQGAGESRGGKIGVDVEGLTGVDFLTEW